MKKIAFAAASALILSAGAASAQSVVQNYSYSAPSGMFSNGTNKWQNYRFMAEDRERTARLRAGENIATGSIQGSAGEMEQYRRPGQYGRTHRTSRY